MSFYFRAITRFARVLRDLIYFQKLNYTVARAFDDVVKRDPKKVVLCFEDEKWTAEKVSTI
jgi:hypothetical protein